MSTSILLYAHAHVYTNTHKHTHTYTNTYTYTKVWNLKLECPQRPFLLKNTKHGDGEKIRLVYISLLLGSHLCCASPMTLLMSLRTGSMSFSSGPLQTPRPARAAPLPLRLPLLAMRSLRACGLVTCRMQDAYLRSQALSSLSSQEGWASALSSPQPSPPPTHRTQALPGGRKGFSAVRRCFRRGRALRMAAD